MRKIIFLQALLMIAEAQLMAQAATPYNSSSVRGSTIITNYIDPNAGPSTGPGLSISPLEARLNGPLGSSFNNNQVVAPANVSATYAATTSPSTLPVNAYGTPATSLYSNSANPSRLAPNRLGVSPNSNLGSLSNSNIEGASRGASYNASGLPTPAPLLPVMGLEPESYGGFAEEPTYLFPGLVRQRLGQWVGSDYLFNMYSNIGVVVEVVTPSDLPSLVNSDEIKQNISEIFANAGINPYAESFLEQPPLPFFHLIVLVSQVDNSYVFSMSGRFFEAVKIPRLNFKTPGTSQAITWEKQELVSTSQARFLEQVTYSAREIAELFIQRVNFFKYQRIEQDEMLKMRCAPAPRVKCPPRLKYMGHKITY